MILGGPREPHVGENSLGEMSHDLMFKQTDYIDLFDSFLDGRCTPLIYL